MAEITLAPLLLKPQVLAPSHWQGEGYINHLHLEVPSLKLARKVEFNCGMHIESG